MWWPRRTTAIQLGFSFISINFNNPTYFHFSDYGTVWPRRAIPIQLLYGKRIEGFIARAVLSKRGYVWKGFFTHTDHILLYFHWNTVPQVTHLSAAIAPSILKVIMVSEYTYQWYTAGTRKSSTPLDLVFILNKCFPPHCV